MPVPCQRAAVTMRLTLHHAPHASLPGPTPAPPTTHPCSRLGVLYALFSAACFLALVLLLAAIFNWGCGIKAFTFLTLLLAALLLACVAALSGGLKAGSDG